MPALARIRYKRIVHFDRRLAQRIRGLDPEGRLRQDLELHDGYQPVMSGFCWHRKGAPPRFVANPREAAELAIALNKNAARFRGRSPAVCAYFIMLGPPPFGDPDQWSFDQLQTWAGRSLGWITDRLGTGSIIAAAALHSHGREPNVQVLAVIGDDQGRPGWNRVKMRFALGNSGRETGPALMAAMLTGYARATGLPRPPPGGKKPAVRQRVEELRKQVLSIRREHDKALREIEELRARLR